VLRKLAQPGVEFGGRCPPHIGGEFSSSCLNLRGCLLDGLEIANFLTGRHHVPSESTRCPCHIVGRFLVLLYHSYGKPEYVKSTKKACTYCHVDSKAKPKELTEAGKYFAEHKNFDGIPGERSR